jgi:hypothetical protein
MTDKTTKEYKCILVEPTDPMLMWNCAVIIAVFIIFIIVIYLNWKPICSNQPSKTGMPVDASSLLPTSSISPISPIYTNPFD